MTFKPKPEYILDQFTDSMRKSVRTSKCKVISFSCPNDLADQIERVTQLLGNYKRSAVIVAAIRRSLTLIERMLSDRTPYVTKDPVKEPINKRNTLDRIPDLKKP